MSNRKKLCLLFLFILFDVVLIIGYLVIRDATLLNELKKEVLEIEKFDITKDRYNTSIKTKGNYAVVEKAIKKYMDDYAVLLQSSLEIIKDPKLTKILSYSNYESDGPEFNESLVYLNDTKTKFNRNLDKLIADADENNINKYINDITDDKNSRELYVELMSDDRMRSNFSDVKSLLVDTKTRVNNVFDVSVEVLTFLVNNKESWKLEEGEIRFLTEDLYNQYISLINKVK